MKALRIIIIILLASFSITIFSQNQQGYVKTLGRPNQKGHALSGVSIRAKGTHNAVLSKTNGTFAIPMSGKKDGESYSLQQIQKTGYELNDINMIGRSYAFSTSVPLTIVMVSSQQLLNDKRRIEDNAYIAAEKNYKRKQSLLEEQKKKNEITLLQYREQLKDLQDKFNKYQSLIDEMAEHYARTDYDNLNEKEREINICIENGELEQAESILQQIGFIQRIANINNLIFSGQQLKNAANNDMATILKQQEKDAEHLYQLYTIALARLDFTKAEQYIETRAALDSTNFEWSSEAAEFHQKQNNFKKSEQYYIQVLKIGKEMVSKDSLNLFLYAMSLNNLGVLYNDATRFSESEKMHLEALKIRKKLNEEFSPEHDEYVAESLNNLAALYSDMKRLSESKEAFEEAINIYRKQIDNSDKRHEADLAICLSNVGVLYNKLSNINASEKCLLEAISLYKQLDETNQARYKYDLSIALSGLATLYSETNRFKESTILYNEAINTQREFASKNPAAYLPELLKTLYNASLLYYKNMSYAECEKLVFDAVTVLDNIDSINSGVYLPIASKQDVADLLNNLGNKYKKRNNLVASIRIFREALRIYQKLSEENVIYLIDVTMTLNNIAGIYLHNKDFTESEKLYNASIRICKDTKTNNIVEIYPELFRALYSMGEIFCNKKDYVESEKYYKEAVAIYNLSINDSYRIEFANSLFHLATSLYNMNNIDECIKYYISAINVYKSIPEQFADSRKNYILTLYIVEQLYGMQKDYHEAYHYALELMPMIKQSYYRDPLEWKEEYVMSLGHIAYYSIIKKQYEDAEKYAETGLMINPTEDWIATTLAASLLFQGKIQKAKAIYSKYNIKLSEFEEDFSIFEKYDVIPLQYKKYIEEIKNCLKEN